MPKLTDKQEAFCQEYLIDLNATQAAIRAGYSEHTANVIGPENLAKPCIAEKIAELKAERSERVQVDADFVLQGLINVATRCMQEEEVMIRNADGSMIGSGEYKFEHSGANRAYELLGKHLKLFTDKSELTGKDGAPLVPEAIKVIYE
jgi:phage terminase small subunit